MLFPISWYALHSLVFHPFLGSPSIPWYLNPFLSFPSFPWSSIPWSSILSLVFHPIFEVLFPNFLVFHPFPFLGISSFPSYFTQSLVLFFFPCSLVFPPLCFTVPSHFQHSFLFFPHPLIFPHVFLIILSHFSVSMATLYCSFPFFRIPSY